ncbi:capsular biosynthesis protein [Methylobacterium sp. J-068]|uniref:capsular polysaccharide export protein, LipB/KpsS family n=1 Tax=Methylobacterium sp. J-068 TaxID=2836649 RepID=UPI001FBA90F5|nr:capsular biosynthesis protein [Methylobacterium sp. J-068]MCJ2035445.1 capsular biosynthesis protein [Methylobacterium sp. J-068]
MPSNSPSPVFSTGRTIRALRGQIERAAGIVFGPPWRSGAAPAFWERNPLADAASRFGRAPLLVEPGPLLTPYDTPFTGMASLRLSGAGLHTRASGDTTGIDLAALRAARTFGRNRFARDDAQLISDTLAGLPAASLILAEGSLARSSARLRAVVARAEARYPEESFIVAGSEGCPVILAASPERLRIIGRPVDPWALFPRVRRVLVADWRHACEARLAGAEVVCLGDAGKPPGSDAPTTEELVALRYGGGTHYFDPWTREPISFGDCLERVVWLRGRFAGNDRPTVLVGISRWKRPALDAFMRGPHGDPIHTMTAEDAVAAARLHRARVLVWATRMPERLEPLCAEEGVPLARIEDGFLRSVGLGASLQPGASIVVDDRGIYYDPRTESRLATILRTATFAPDLVARARALREGVIERRLTKYNVGLSEDTATWPKDRRIVLVPGQVEDDASVMHGSPIVRSNRDLLRAARARNPDAFLLYKPHPDVEAGFRPGTIPEAEILGLADRIVGGLSIVDLLDRAHHVETMTSLTGFEALIRGLSVAVHGRPFYSGWGLSEDLAPGADRGRRLALDELVAGTLLLYPLYLDPVAMKPCSAEQLLDRLSAARDAAGPSRLALSRGALLVMRARYAVLNPLVRRLREKRGVTKAEDPRR